MTAATAEAVIGHNRPPAFDPDALAALRARLEELNESVGEELDAGQIEDGDEDRAGRMLDRLRAVQAVEKDSDAQRKQDKQPHLDAGRDVDAAYSTVIEPAKGMAKRLKAMLQDFTSRKQRAAAEAKRKAEEEARRIAEEARKAAEAAAKRNDALGQDEAEARAREAEREAERIAATETRARIESASGVGRVASIRTRKVLVCTDLRAAFLTLQPLYPVDLATALERIGREAVKQGHDVTALRGFEIQTKEEIA